MINHRLILPCGAILPNRIAKAAMSEVKLFLRGKNGDADLSLPILAGHEKYLAFVAHASNIRKKK